jgi:periplasmic divalent cation tolerance protein
MHSDGCLLVLCTVPDRGLGETIAAALVGEGLAACVNRLPGVTSTYRWQGEVISDSEELLLIKTTGARFEVLRQRIRALHRYDVPEIIALPVAAGDADYLNWLRDSVQPP